MVQSGKKITKGETNTNVTCENCNRSWGEHDNKSAKKILEMHNKAVHPNAIRVNHRRTVIRMLTNNVQF
jgi:hypothetical protein